MFITCAEDLAFHRHDTRSVIARYEPSPPSLLPSAISGSTNGNNKGSRRCAVAASSPPHVTSASWSHDNNFVVYLTSDRDSVPTVLRCTGLTSVASGLTGSCIGNETGPMVRQVRQACQSVGYTSVKFPRSSKRYIVCGTRKGEILVYSNKTRDVDAGVFVPMHERGSVHLLDFNANDGLLATAAEQDCTVNWYSNVTGGAALDLCSLSVPCSCLRFHPTRCELLGMGSEDGYVSMYNVDVNRSVMNKKLHCGRVAGVAYSERHNFCATVGSDRKFVISSLGSSSGGGSDPPRAVIASAHLPHRLTCVDLCDSRNALLIGTESGRVHVYDIRRFLAPLHTFRAHDGPISCIFYDNAGSGGSATMISSAGDGVTLPAPNTTSTHCQNAAMMVPADASMTPPPFLKWVSDRCIADTSLRVEEFAKNINLRLSQLKEFMWQEMTKVNTQSHDKWDVLIAATTGGNSSTGITSSMRASTSVNTSTRDPAYHTST